MTSDPHNSPSASPDRPHRILADVSPAARAWTRIQFVLFLLITSGLLAYLLCGPTTGTSHAKEETPADAAETVRLTGPKSIWIQPDSPLAKKLAVTTVTDSAITAPVLTVTGTVTASLRPGNGKGKDYWQFNSPDLLTAFTDWQKATADITFAETQLAQTRQLAETRTDAQQKLVERMKKLVEVGTDTEKDLAAAQADLLQSQIQGRKDVYEAETAARLAKRTEAALARQLQQAGLEPDMLLSTTSDVDVVMADVPEGMMSKVKVEQKCEARFFGIPDKLFAGKVCVIAPVLSQERRTLRVLFAINDPEDQLRPGMFADIGLGTDARNALLIPTEGIVHVGRSDYVLRQGEDGQWQVAEVHIGEARNDAVESLGGLQAGDRIASQGAILLKPYMIRALQTHALPCERTHDSEAD